MKEFKEEQKMRQWWLWALLIAVAGVWVWDLIQQILGLKPTDIAGLFVGFFIIGPVLIFFYTLKLKTEFNADGIRINYSILANKRIKWEDVKELEIVRYGFVGYGLRFSFKYGIVYNTHGNMGLFIKNKKSGKLLIGTQHPEEVNQVVKQYIQ